MPKARKKKATTILSASDVYEIIENFLKKKYKDSFQSLEMPDCELITEKGTSDKYYRSQVKYSTSNRMGDFSAIVHVDAINGAITYYKEKYYGVFDGMFE